MQFSSKDDNTFYIVDGYGFIFRAFFALPKLTSKNGEPIGAVYGFFKMLISFINSSRPEYMAIALDTGGRTFRDDLYDKFMEKQSIKELFSVYQDRFLMFDITLEQLLNTDVLSLIDILHVDRKDCIALCEKFGIQGEQIPKLFPIMIFLQITDTLTVEDCKSQYKANRPETPVELRTQFRIVDEFIDAIGIKTKKVIGYEADDVIASMSKQLVESGKKVVIISADKDLCQLVKDNEVAVYDPVHKVYLNEAGVFKKFGVRAEQVVDYLSIIGDKCDNVYGVDGVGPKGAVSLLSEYGTIDNILKNLSSLKESVRAKFESSRERLELAQALIRLRFDALKIEDIKDFKLNIDQQGLSSFIEKYGFKSIDALNRKGELRNMVKDERQQEKGLFDC